MTKRPEPHRHVMNLFQHLVYSFSPFSRCTFHPRPCLPAGRHRTGFPGTILIKELADNKPGFDAGFVPKIEAIEASGSRGTNWHIQAKKF